MGAKNPHAQAMAKQRWAGTTKAQRKEHASAIGKLGGRPIKLIHCPRGCGHTAGVVAMREHKCVA